MFFFIVSEIRVVSIAVALCEWRQTDKDTDFFKNNRCPPAGQGLPDINEEAAPGGAASV